jgi:predicted alpha/beta hydrolase family esterase
MAYQGEPVRVLIVPGLGGSEPEHWQSWLQPQYKSSVRVEQERWQHADLEAWAERIGATLARQRPGPWVAVAHSFGCLALVRHLLTDGPQSPIAGALLVAPASPEKFHVAHRLPLDRLQVPSVVVASDTDPWMRAAEAHRWARRWGSRYLNLGDAGHINVAAGFKSFPLAKLLTQRLIQRVERHRRLDRVHPAELSFAI